MAEVANISQAVVDLKPETRRVLTRINGARSVGEIAKSIGMDEAATTRTTDTLLTAGVLVTNASRSHREASISSGR